MKTKFGIYDKDDVKTIAIHNAGYWELDEKSRNLLKEQEKKKEMKTFMRLHQKQISEIMRSW
ncbi:MAG: hypothetical protein N3G74_02635 [Candidatus Micrarchaeota archaeon]|nr:hypothetical protein [Candidatus Micrarchaeota archaeon]